MSNGYGAYGHGGHIVKEWGPNSILAPRPAPPPPRTNADPPPAQLFSADPGNGQPHVPWIQVDANGNLYVYGNLLVPPLSPSGDNTGTTDTLVMQNQLNTTGVLNLNDGVFQTNQPIVGPSYSMINGVLPIDQSGNNLTGGGTIIQPVPGFTVPAGVESAVIAYGTSSSSTTNRPAIRNVLINGSNLGGTVHGIGTQGVINALNVQACGALQVSGDGLHESAPSGGFSDGWLIRDWISQQCGGSGMSGQFSDMTADNVHLQSNGSFGLFHFGGGNAYYGNLRCDLNAQDGARIFAPAASAAGGFLDSVRWVGGSTQRNQKFGCNVVNSTASGVGPCMPVELTGVSLDGDAVAYNGTGTESAALGLGGQVLVTMTGGAILVSTVDVGGGVPLIGVHPYNLGTTPGAPSALIMTGVFINAITAAYDNATVIGAKSLVNCWQFLGAQWTGQTPTNIT